MAPLAPLAPAPQRRRRVAAERGAATPIAEAGAAAAAPAAVPAAALPAVDAPTIDWSRFAAASAHAPPVGRATASRPATPRCACARRCSTAWSTRPARCRITRSRIEADVGAAQGSLGDLTENLERLRRQLRDIELQAETQISSRMEAAKAASQAFDPLEFDRFTRFQELTRMMAESVNDVATVQRSLQRTLQSTEDELAAQARLTRDLQDDLLRTRMVEFESMSERLYRVVRQAAKETGKQVRLDIVGGSIEVDRGVLDRMTGAFEHLLRNCVTHGIESPDGARRRGQGRHRPDHRRADATKATKSRSSSATTAPASTWRASATRARAMGLIAAGAQPERRRARQPDLHARASRPPTAVTELAGRGVGMDVVRAEVNAMGGRIETATAAGQGTSFRLVLPLTTAVTQVVMLRCGDVTVAVPSTLVEIVRARQPDELAAAPTPTRQLPHRRQAACRSSGSARCCKASARSREAARTHAGGGHPQRRSSALRCTSTKCWATRKWWSRTSGRSCRACRAWPA